MQSIINGNASPLQKKRLEYKPATPEILKNLTQVSFKPVQRTRFPHENLRKLFPKTMDQQPQSLIKGKGKICACKIGVVFSGGPAAGGHNVIAAICDAGAKVVGFLGGPSGIVDNDSIEIDLKKVDGYRNQGGFDLIGSGRTKIELEEQLAAALKTVQSHKLDGLVIIGGDDSNTNAAILAEYFLAKGCVTRVIGVPKTIDGDLRSEDIEMSFGFDSACKTYSELIGNIARDAISSRKYYHFIKVMGRSASHIALECALATHPNLTLISEERKGLQEIVKEIVNLIQRRKEAGKEYGVIVVPEGLPEFIPDLSVPNVGRDSHGNLQVSQIQTEKLLIELVQKETGGKLQAQEHFLGYEGRCCFPSNFDSNYTYTLGCLAAIAVREGLTGMICSVQNMKKTPLEWELKMVPIIDLMHLEMRAGKEKPVIQKYLIDLKDKSFVYFSRLRKSWEIEDQYRYPGPIQFFGDPELTDSPPVILTV